MMGFDIGQAINSATNKALSMPRIEAIAVNPVYTAILITIIIMLIILVVFRDAETEEALIRMALRIGFYIFFVLAGALVIHNKALMKETTGAAQGSDVERIFRGDYSGVLLSGDKISSAVEDAIVPVKVNYEFND